MKNISEYLNESLLLEADIIDQELAKECIDWILDNYLDYHSPIKPNKLKVDKKLNSDGKIIIKTNLKGITLKSSATSITNGKFVWDKVYKGDMFCVWKNDNITNLEGCPDKIENGDFYCNDCKNLKTLDGGPSYVSEVYDCSNCENLENLLGAARHARTFNCENCNKLESLIELADTVYNVICDNCSNLKRLFLSRSSITSLSCCNCPKLSNLSFPKLILKDLKCWGTKFTKDLIQRHCKVNGTIYT
jgi:hypothetical protein